MSGRTFRLFISSPFSDFKAEREVLQQEVFPSIEKYCASHGYQFQPIDLRWGINEEAQFDQKTLEICLNEVRVCKHYPQPNFLIMQGDRYGWIPLPYEIEKNEFEQILEYHSANTRGMNMLTDWYKHDLNHILSDGSTFYVLQPRTDKYKDQNSWQKIERTLRNLLQQAAKNIRFANEKEKAKYFLSATEQEVIEGIFKYFGMTESQKEMQRENADLPFLNDEYVYGFIRHIRNRTGQATGSIFFDHNLDGTVKFKTNLVKTLPDENILELETEFTGDNRLDGNYLDIFARKFIEYLKRSIKTQIENIKQIGMLEREKNEHELFMRNITNVFTGRSGVLTKIETYLNSHSIAPLVIYGVSGIGKSALMAKAALNAGESYPGNTIFRFVGASGNTSTVRGLLLSIVNEIDGRQMEELTGTYNKEKFEALVRKTLSEVKNKTVIFIDALDQLRDKSHLGWLPQEFPANLKVVVSVLDDENYKEDSEYLKILKEIYQNNSSPDNFIALEPLTTENGAQILEQSLLKINRQLTPPQKELVLKNYKQAGYSPLYLRIAIEEVKNWRSFDKVPEGRRIESVELLIGEFIRNLSALYHHQDVLVLKTLGYIQCSQNGLSEKEIIDLLSNDREVVTLLENVYHRKHSNKIPIAPWARLYYQLSPFLIKKLADGVSIITFFHRQFVREVQESVVNNETIRNSIHRSMAAYYREQPLDYGGGVYNLRKLTEYYYQLYQTKQIDKLLELLGRDYIKIKNHTGRLNECLFELGQAFNLVCETKRNVRQKKEQFFASVLQFLSDYREETGELFRFDTIHAYFIYPEISPFYRELLKYISDKNTLGKYFGNLGILDDYYLLFITQYVGLLRRNRDFKTGFRFANEIKDATMEKLKSARNDKALLKDLSIVHYEIGYMHYLTGNFEKAGEAFSRGIDIEREIPDEVGEWFTKVVMNRISFIGGVTSVQEYEQALDNAVDVFKKYESDNHVARRWVSVCSEHKFEVAYHNNDLDKMIFYYKKMVRDEMSKKYNEELSLFKARIELTKKNYRTAITLFNDFLGKFPQEQLQKREAIVDVLYERGLAHFQDKKVTEALRIWRKALTFGDEPGNHRPKQKVKEVLKQLNTEP